VEVDISILKPGEQLTEEWRGKPVWIVRGPDSSIRALSEISDSLRDPDSQEDQQPEYAQNEYRSIKAEYFVVIGLCTHLTCSPTYLPVDAPHDLDPDWRGGFFGPCHGSRFDLAGRVYKGVPAPTTWLSHHINS
jgi:ubiquinol-cytochrome c reductase iron-sulfur subunit